MEEVKTIKEGFVGEIKGIIDKAREGAVRSVNFSRVIMYWNIGRRIFEEARVWERVRDEAVKSLQTIL